MYAYAAAFFFATFLSQVCSIGALVGTSLSTVGAWSTCVVVAFQTLGVLLGIGISQVAKKKPKSPLLRPDFLNLLAAAASTAIVLLPALKGFWLIAMLVRASAGSLLMAAMLTSARLYSADVLKSNRIMQLARTGAFVVALATAPLIAGIFGTKDVFLVDAIGSFVLALSLWKLRDTASPTKLAASPTKLAASPLPTQKYEAQVDKAFDNGIYLIFGVIFLSWCAGGIFHVLEVPILKERFHLEPKMITGVFLIAGIANLLTVKLLPVSRAGQQLTSIFLVSALCIFAATLSYLFIGALPALFATVALLGAANGVFTLSQTSIIQNIEDAALRLNGFLFSRLASQLGLLASTCMVMLLSSTSTDVSQVAVAVGVLGGITLLIALLTKLKLVKVTGSSAAVALIVLLFTTQIKAADQDTLNIPLREIPTSLDPQLVTDISTAMVTNQVFENLYVYAGDNSLVPALASGHTISPDGKTITITLRNGHIFSDGTPVTSSHVIAALNRAATKLGKSISWAMQDVDGFEELVSGASSSLKGVEALDQRKVKITLTRPSPRFLQALTATGFSVGLPKEGKWIGSGFYELASSAPERQLILKKRATAPTSSFERIAFIASKDQIEDEALLRAGQIDIVSLDGRANVSFAGYNRMEQDYLQAVVFLLNKNSVQFKTAKQRCKFVANFKSAALASGYQWQPMDLGLPFARDIFSSDGKLSDANPHYNPKIKISTTDSVAKFTNEIDRGIIREMVKSHYKLDFSRTSVRDMVKEVRKKNFDAVAYGYLLDYADPDALFSPLLGTGEQYNLTGFSDPTIDSLLRVGRSLGDRESRNILYQEVVANLTKSCEVSFLGGQKVEIFYSNKLSIPHPSSLGFHRMLLSNVRKINDDKK